MVCHDGSSASDVALNVIQPRETNIFGPGLLKEGDNLFVAHAWAQEKEEYLKWKHKKDNVNASVCSDYVWLNKNFRYIEREIMSDQDETAKSVLTSAAKEAKATVTVCGWHGRKGPKEDPTCMGTSVQFLAIQCPGPTMIIKKPVSRYDYPTGYTMAGLSDGSK